MKRFIACLMVLAVVFGSCFAAADEYDLQNMTTRELRELIDTVEEELDAHHKASSTDQNRTESAVKAFVEDYYGGDNVDWAWLDYEYTRDWDFVTMTTHADITKQDGGQARYDVYGEVFLTNGGYDVAYVRIGSEVIYDARGTVITDSRVLSTLDSVGSDAVLSSGRASDAGEEHSAETAGTEESPSAQKEYPAFTVEELCEKYDKNELAADNELKGEYIKVTGRVYSVSEGWFGTIDVTLDAGEFSWDMVSCSFDDSAADDLSRIAEGDKVTVLGKCAGKAFGVSLDDCTLVK